MSAIPPKPDLFCEGCKSQQGRIDTLEAALLIYRKSLDAIYNENKTARRAVVKHFGIHHLPMGEIEAVGAALSSTQNEETK